MVDRMEFEELSLKSIDLSMSPSVAHLRSSPLSEKAPSSVRTVPFCINIALTREIKISLVFPPSFLSPSEVLSELREYSEHRILKHRKGLYLWVLIAPLTAPFMIIRAST
jgi:Mitochondrial K+-H+ exchange-related